MWVILWALISVFVLCVFVWSIKILQEQKRTWKAYADKMGLTYTKGFNFLASPSLSGSIGNYGFGLFSEEQETDNAKVQRFNTVLEIALRRGLPVMGAVGTEKMTALVQSLGLEQTFTPDTKDWNPAWIVRARHVGMMEKFLTPVRIDVFKKIFGMKILAALFIFDNQDAVLRIETADPLSNLDRLDKIVKGLIAQADILLVKEDERAVLDAFVTST